MDGAMVTAFGQLRVAEPFSIFDSKQLSDNQPLFWDDKETNGSGTGSSHSTNTSSTTLSVSDGTEGTRTRQTFQRFNYQPGKSMVVVMTGILGVGASGITSQIGYIDDNDGLAFETVDGVVNVNRRTSTSGSAVNNRVAQSSWNLDPMDGTGHSRVTIDFTLTQQFFIDFQWLSVGRARMGFDIDGTLIYCHEFLNANTITVPYMSTPNLPIRYELVNDGNGPAATLNHICVAVYSEGGLEDLGVDHWESTTSNRAGATTHISANTIDTPYALVGIRLKSTHLGTTINLLGLSILSETADNFEWLVLFNPTVDGTFAFDDRTNSACQSATGNAANPSLNHITALGTVLAGGYGSTTNQGGDLATELKDELKLGAAIDGTPDEIVLAVRPLSANADIHGGLEWKELT